jgi:hypothetical protein
MTPADLTLGTEFDRLQRNSLMIGIIALIICIIGAFFSPVQFFHSYLMAYLFWSGITLGCFAVVMIHHMVGGGWGFIIRRLLEAGTRTIVLIALLVIPIIFGVTYLYVWAHPENMQASEVLQHKSIYLNTTFFVFRNIFYFCVWFVLAYYLNKWSAEQDLNPSLAVIKRLQNLSGPGLLLYGFTMSFAAVDWIMSLEPLFFSTIYSAMFMVGQVLSCFALVISLVILLAGRPQFSRILAPKYLNDLGNMMFAFLILWAYTQFSQFLIVWAGNLTDEIPWYLRRMQGGWWAVAWAVIVFHFFVPLGILLSRKVKRRIQLLAKLAAAFLVIRLFEMFWMVEPAFNSHVEFHWMDWVLPIGMGGIWIAWFISRLKKRPLFPLRDPRLEAAFARIDERRVGDV